MLILIQDESWWVDHEPYGTRRREFEWKLSYEWETKMKEDIPIFDDDRVLAAMPPNQSVMSGVAAFYLGIQKARTILEPGR